MEKSDEEASDDDSASPVTEEPLVITGTHVKTRMDTGQE